VVESASGRRGRIVLWALVTLSILLGSAALVLGARILAGTQLNSFVLRATAACNREGASDAPCRLVAIDAGLSNEAYFERGEEAFIYCAAFYKTVPRRCDR